MRAIIVAGFPGVGKSMFVKNHPEILLLDSDSSTFSWIERGVRNPDFPNNYVAHIKENRDKYKVIFVSTHDIVLRALVENELFHFRAVPVIPLKEEYLKRYASRGDSQDFINLIDSNWDNWINNLCHINPYSTMWFLYAGQTLEDYKDLFKEKP